MKSNSSNRNISAKSLLRGTLLASFAAVAATCIGISTASAVPVAYTLTPGSSTLLIGDTYSLTATFDWDSTTSLESLVDITLSGSGGLAGNYTDNPALISAVQTQVSDNKDICGANGSIGICLRFTDPLGGSPNLLDVVASGNHAPDLNAPATGFDGDPTGSAVFAAVTTGGVPEPVTLSVFGAGVVGAAVMRRRRKSTKA